MKSLIPCIALLFSISNIYGQSKPARQSVIGSTYRNINKLPSFTGYKMQIGAMLDPTEANYGVSIVAKGRFNVMILDTCIKSGNSIRYKILDTVNIGSIPSAQSIVTSGCRVRKRNNNNIIAIVKLGDKEYTNNVFRAWKINRSKHRIEQISVKGLDCLNEGYGL